MSSTPSRSETMTTGVLTAACLSLPTTSGPDASGSRGSRRMTSNAPCFGDTFHAGECDIKFDVLIYEHPLELAGRVIVAGDYQNAHGHAPWSSSLMLHWIQPPPETLMSLIRIQTSPSLGCSGLTKNHGPPAAFGRPSLPAPSSPLRSRVKAKASAPDGAALPHFLGAAPSARDGRLRKPWRGERLCLTWPRVFRCWLPNRSAGPP
jgi:hypothetical protein